MKITRPVAAPLTVTIQRLDGEHQHDLTRKRQRDCTVISSHSVSSRRSGKGIWNSAGPVMKGVGTPQGTECLNAVSGQHLER